MIIHTPERNHGGPPLGETLLVKRVTAGARQRGCRTRWPLMYSRMGCRERVTDSPEFLVRSDWVEWGSLCGRP